MKYLAVDSETCLVTLETLTPHLICVSWFDGQESGLLHWKDSGGWLLEKIKGATAECPLVFHNAPFDLAVFANQFPELLPEIFAALDRDAIRDTQVREKLIYIAQGTKYKTTLKDLVKRYFGQDLEKDEWRLGYEKFKEIPLSDWPQGAKDYAITDAVVTGKVYEVQFDNPFGVEVFADESRQNRANFALHLASCYGVITDSVALQDLEQKTRAEYLQLKSQLETTGLVDEWGKRDDKKTQALVLEALGDDAPRTPKGKIQTSEEACEKTKDPNLKALARFRQLQTLLSKDIETMKKGLQHPIRTRYDVLLNTGRTSSSKPNLQNPRREPGVRECFIPRPGFVYCSVDYEAAELHTLAQVCYSLLGYSIMRERLNAHADLHLDFAAKMAGISYEEALARRKEPEIKEMRQRAKVANFGYPGGMGIDKFSIYAEDYGLNLDIKECKLLRDQWLAAYPEMRDYFKWINSLLAGSKTCNIVHFLSDRFRGDVWYTEACNSFFQGLAADGAKAAFYKLIETCYNEPNNVLFGSRPVLFVHDEAIMEVPEKTAHECACEMTRIMVEEFNRWTPDVPVKAEPCLMRRWQKEAQTVYVDGRLVPWEST